MESVGVSDISSSEGRLRHFTDICKIMDMHKSLKQKKIEELMKECMKLKNHNVRMRHIVISQKIGLIEKLGDLYTLSSQGKALRGLVSSARFGPELSVEERIFYFRALFTSVFKEQLHILLKTILSTPSGLRTEIIKNYFNTPFAQKVWNKKTILINLTKLEKEAKISSFFGNKFGCMETWLRELGMIWKKNGRLFVTKNTKMMLDGIKSTSDINKAIYKMAGITMFGEVTKFDFKLYQNEVLEKLKNAYNAFKTDMQISDIRAIMTFVCTSFLTRKVLIEEEDFNRVIKHLWSKGIVRSVMRGSDGKPAHIIFSRTSFT